ncbi:hypothetical protein ACIP79_00590 [Streptomyces sp. NPDC088747]|uniref:hypothetical protein n=1 Tax=Streptomyces sp. NPDC088747 TaxID=3365886 RepID=UPI00382CEE79
MSFLPRFLHRWFAAAAGYGWLPPPLSCSRPTPTKEQRMQLSRMPRLTPEGLDDILATEPKARAVLDGNDRPIGVEVPLPDGMTDTTGGTNSQTRTAMFGDRVGQDRYGNWLVVSAAP